jgi:hypothetical protein
VRFRVHTSVWASPSSAPVRPEAYDERPRLLRKQLNIESNYYMIATGDLVKASQVFELYVQTYPRDSRAYSNLGYRLVPRTLRQSVAGVSCGPSKLDPDDVRNYTNVAGCLINMNRFDEAGSAAAGATTQA